MDARHDGSSPVLPVVDGQGPASFDAPKKPRANARLDSRSDSRIRPRKKSFPPVDDHLVVPEVTRDEMIRGRKVVAMAALPPHADAQTGANFLLAAHVAPGYVASTELLTRVSEGSDFATDVSIRKEGIDPQSGQRYLEELSFEIVNEQRMRDITDKASELTQRGVRRVFAIFVKRDEIGEWSRKEKKFILVDNEAMFIDEALVRPIAFRALIDNALAEVEVVRALAVKGNPEIARIQQAGVDKGHKEGRKEGHKEGRKEGRKEGHKEGRKENLELTKASRRDSTRANSMDAAIR
jgi:hypothetical protein